MDLIRACLLWLDAETWRYWTLAWAALAGTTLLAWFPHRRPASAWSKPLMFTLGLVGTFFAFRWPVWFSPDIFNPDESQIIASALTLKQYPVYWKYVDGTSHGPLVELPLICASWLGAPFSYVTARVVATLCQIAALLALWQALRRLMQEHLARIGILPGLAFWSLVSWEDFNHYSSEHFGVFLLSLTLWPLARMVRVETTDKLHWGELVILGLTCGAVPFAKLQSAPQAVATGLLAVYAVWKTGNATGRRSLHLILLIGAAVIPSTVTAIFLSIYGLWNQFIASYLMSGIAYMEFAAHRFANMPGRFFTFAAPAPLFLWFFLGCLVFAAYGFRTKNGAPADNRRALAAAILLLFAALFCVIRPGRDATHYLHLLVVPMTAVAALVLARMDLEATAESRSPAGMRPSHLMVFAMLTLLPQAYERATGWNRFAGYLAEHLAKPLSPASQIILRQAERTDRLAVWGWEPHLNVETGLPHGTREAHSSSQLAPWSMQHFFRDRYVFDMNRWQPRWFVDAVGPGGFIYDNRAVQGHEVVPDLRELIARKYELIAEVENKRIYRRKTSETRP